MELGFVNGDKLTNAEYHATEGFFSSSQLKTAMNDIETFKKQYITKELVNDFHIPAFDVGTYYHTAILEPNKLEEECAVFEGAVRRGKVWEAFKELHAGKAIITLKEKLQAENLIKATQNSDRAMEILNGGVPELSCFTELAGMRVKVRADWIAMKSGYLLDLKSTTGNAKDVQSIQKKISNYDYDLSASLYLDAFNSALAKSEVDAKPLTDFYWVFASKDVSNCKVYKASPEMLEVGRAKYMKAIYNIKKYHALGWEIPDEIENLSPLPWEKDMWLKGDDSKNQKIYNTAKTKIRQTTDGDLL